jgi:membrane associated rhomboid family serine protease
MFFIPYGTVESTPRRSFPYVNVFIVVLNVLVFAFQFYLLATLGQSGLEDFFAKYSFVPAAFSHNLLQISLLTSLFIHAGLLHIVGNMAYLLPFGDNVEDRLGHAKYLFFYVVCGIIATIIYALFNLNSTTPLVGASGAIAGVLGGYIALHPTRSKVKGFLWIIIILIRIRLPALLFIGYWFLMQLFSTVASLGPNTSAAGGGVAFLAHVGGFMAGLVLAPLLANRLEPATEV